MIEKVKANYEKEIDEYRDEADKLKTRIMQKELENDRMLRHIMRIEQLFIISQHEQPEFNFRTEKKHKTHDAETIAAMRQEVETYANEAVEINRIIKSQASTMEI